MHHVLPPQWKTCLILSIQLRKNHGTEYLSCIANNILCVTSAFSLLSFKGLYLRKYMPLSTAALSE